MDVKETKAALDALDEPPHPSCPCVVGVLLEKRIRELEPALEFSEEMNQKLRDENQRLREAIEKHREEYVVGDDDDEVLWQALEVE